MPHPLYFHHNPNQSFSLSIITLFSNLPQAALFPTPSAPQLIYAVAQHSGGLRPAAVAALRLLHNDDYQGKPLGAAITIKFCLSERTFYQVAVSYIVEGVPSRKECRGWM